MTSTITLDHATWHAMGTTDEITTCQICGKPELKGTVRMVLIARHDNEHLEEIYAGTVCAARRTGRKTADIRTEAKRADDAALKAKQDAWNEWSDRRHAWFMTQRDAEFGTDGPQGRDRVRIILAWSSTPEFLARQAEWDSVNPAPQNPRG